MQAVPLILVTLACWSVVVASGGCAQQSPTASAPTEFKITEGKVEVVRDDGFAKPLGPVNVERIPWDASFGTSAITVKIPGTGLAIKVVEGKVSPILVQEHPLEVWRITGMRFKSSDIEIEGANRIEPSDGRLQLILDGGDVYEGWTLDFTDPKKGLQIRYRDAGGW
jgi:hypothetical protein